MNFTALWPEIVVILGGASDVFHGQISAYIASHPTVAMILAALLMLLSKFQQSPIPPTVPPKA